MKTASALLARIPISLSCLCLLALATPAPSAEGGFGLKLIAEGFTSPLTAQSLPDGSGRLLVADQVGTVHVLDKEGKISDQLFMDLRSRMVTLNAGFDERGLLGLALHPDFKSNRRLFVYYSAPLRKGAPTNWNHTSHISEFKINSDLNSVDATSERVILQIDEPQMNHNCGRILFGPDGYLYIGTGDGGGANDGANVKADDSVGHSPQGNGQDTSNLLGKILRIDVNKGSGYAIPSDNPFADGKQGKPEIFAFGLRNPWGISFDRGGSRELFAVDVGQNLYEELNIIVKGGNYGWRVREGFHGFDPKSANKSPEDAPTKDASGRPFIDPVLEYGRPPKSKPPSQTEPQGISVTGGYVYRGKALPQLEGKYVFADWSRSWALPDGVLFVATRGASKNDRWKVDFLPLVSPANGKLGAYVVGMAEDDQGELYVLTNGRNIVGGKTGKVFKLVSMQPGN